MFRLVSLIFSLLILRVEIIHGTALPSLQSHLLHADDPYSHNLMFMDTILRDKMANAFKSKKLSTSVQSEIRNLVKNLINQNEPENADDRENSSHQLLNDMAKSSLVVPTVTHLPQTNNILRELLKKSAEERKAKESLRDRLLNLQKQPQVKFNSLASLLLEKLRERQKAPLVQQKVLQPAKIAPVLSKSLVTDQTSPALNVASKIANIAPTPTTTAKPTPVLLSHDNAEQLKSTNDIKKCNCTAKSEEKPPVIIQINVQKTKDDVIVSTDKKHLVVRNIHSTGSNLKTKTNVKPEYDVMMAKLQKYLKKHPSALRALNQLASINSI